MALTGTQSIGKAVLELATDATAFLADLDKIKTNTVGLGAGFDRLGKNVSSFDDHLKTIGGHIQSFSGDRIIQQATQMARAVEQVGGADKLTAVEQARVNAVVSDAIAKYQALGQQAPKALVDLATATKAVIAPTDKLAQQAALVRQQFERVSGGKAIQEANALTVAVAKIGGATKLTAAEQTQVNATVTEAIAKYKTLGQQAPPAMLALAEATKQVEKVPLGKSLKEFGDGVKSVGLGLTAGITAPIIAIAGAAFSVGVEYEKALSVISKATGATGDRLKQLGADFHAVNVQVPQDAAVVAAAIGDVTTRLGLTGTALQTATKQFLDFARVNKTEVAESTRVVTQMMNDLGVKADRLPEVLDKLTAAAQASGINANKLAIDLGVADDALQEMGFGLDESIALFASLEKAGAEPTEVIKGLSLAMKSMAKDGVTDAREGLRILIEQIKAAPSLVEASKIAVEAFGKSGVQMAGDIRSGKLEIADMLKVVQGSQGTLDRVGEATKTFSEKFVELKKKALDAAAPIGTQLLGAVVKLKPVLEDALKFVAGLTDEFVHLPQPVQTTAFALAGLFAAAGPVVYISGQLISSLSTIVGAFGKNGIAARILAGDYGFLTTATRTLSGAMFGPLGLIAAITGAAIAYTYFKTSQIRDQAQAMHDASEIVKKAVTNFQDARAILDAFDKGKTGQKLEGPITLDMVAAWQKGAESIRQVGTSAAITNDQIGATELTIAGFGKGITDVGTHAASTAEKLSLLAQLNATYAADLKKIGASGFKEIQTAHDQYSKSVSDLSKQYGVAESSIEHYLKSVSAAGTAERDHAQALKEAAAAQIPLTEAQRATVVAMDAMHLSAEMIAKTLRVSAVPVREYLEALKLASSFNGTAAAAEADKLVKAIGTLGPLSKLGHDNAEQLATAVKHLADGMTEADPAQKILIDRLRAIFKEATLAATGLEKLSLVKPDYTRLLPANQIDGPTIGEQIPLHRPGTLPSQQGVYALPDRIPGLDAWIIQTKEGAEKSREAWKKSAAGVKADGKEMVQTLDEVSRTASALGGAFDNLFGQIASGAATAVSGIGDIASATSDLGKLTAGLDLAISLGVKLQPLLGLHHGKLGDLLGTNRDGRVLVEQFAEIHGGFDQLHKDLLELGPVGEATFKRLTQVVGKSDPKQAAEEIKKATELLASAPSALTDAAGFKTQAELQAIADKAKKVYDFMVQSGQYTAAELADAFQKSSEAQRVALGDVGAASGYKTRAELQLIADQAKKTYESMRDSGLYTADAIADAFQKSKDAQIAAMSDTAKAAHDELTKLDAEYKSLSDSVGAEADEAERGVVETQERARMAAIEQKKAELAEKIRLEEEAAKAKAEADQEAAKQTGSTVEKEAKDAHDRTQDYYTQHPWEIPYRFKPLNTIEVPGGQAPGSDAGAPATWPGATPGASSPAPASEPPSAEPTPGETSSAPRSGIQAPQGERIPGARYKDGGIVGFSQALQAFGTTLPVEHFDIGGEVGRLIPFVPKGPDTVLAGVTPGEVILNAAQQQNVAALLTARDTAAEARLSALTSGRADDTQRASTPQGQLFRELDDALTRATRNLFAVAGPLLREGPQAAQQQLLLTLLTQRTAAADTRLEALQAGRADDTAAVTTPQGALFRQLDETLTRTTHELLTLVGSQPAAAAPGTGSRAGAFVQLPNGQWVPPDHPLAQAAPVAPGATAPPLAPAQQLRVLLDARDTAADVRLSALRDRTADDTSAATPAQAQRFQALDVALTTAKAQLATFVQASGSSPLAGLVTQRNAAFDTRLEALHTGAADDTNVATPAQARLFQQLDVALTGANRQLTVFAETLPATSSAAPQPAPNSLAARLEARTAASDALLEARHGYTAEQGSVAVRPETFAPLEAAVTHTTQRLLESVSTAQRTTLSTLLTARDEAADRRLGALRSGEADDTTAASTVQGQRFQQLDVALTLATHNLNTFAATVPPLTSGLADLREALPPPPVTANTPGAGSKTGAFVQLANGQWVPKDHPLYAAAHPAISTLPANPSTSAPVIPADLLIGPGHDARVAGALPYTTAPIIPPELLAATHLATGGIVPDVPSLLPFSTQRIAAQALATGGEVGHIVQFTKQGTDTVAAMLTPREGVVNVPAMSRLEPEGLDALNTGKPLPARLLPKLIQPGAMTAMAAGIAALLAVTPAMKPQAFARGGVVSNSISSSREQHLALGGIVEPEDFTGLNPVALLQRVISEGGALETLSAGLPTGRASLPPAGRSSSTDAASSRTEHQTVQVSVDLTGAYIDKSDLEDLSLRIVNGIRRGGAVRTAWQRQLGPLVKET